MVYFDIKEKDIKYIILEEMNRIYDYFLSQKYEDDVKRVLLYNELKEFVLNHQYNEIYTFISIYKDMITYKDLYEIVLLYSDIHMLKYMYQYHYAESVLFIPFYSYLLNSVKNRENIEMYEFICKNYKDVNISFHDLINCISVKNYHLLKLFTSYCRNYEPNDHEYEEYITFDIKSFLKEIERCHIDYVELIFEIINKSNYLQSLICNQIGNNVDFQFVSKKKFIEAIKEKISENALSYSHTNDNNTLHLSNASYNYL